MTQTEHFAVQESVIVQKLHQSDMYVVAISCFHSTFRLKTYDEGTYTLNLFLLRFIDSAEIV